MPIAVASTSVAVYYCVKNRNTRIQQRPVIEGEIISTERAMVTEIRNIPIPEN